MHRFLILIGFLTIKTRLEAVCPAESSNEKCSKLLSNLTIGSMENLDIEAAEALNKTCFELVDCYAEIDCEQAQKNKTFYQNLCERKELEMFETEACIKTFHSERKGKSFECMKDFEFFSKDESVRREAYTSGKSCFLEVTQNCSDLSINFIGKRFSHLVSIMARKTDEKSCEPIQDKLLSSQCSWELTELYDELTKQQTHALKSQIKGIVMQNLTEMCQDSKTCLSTGCHVTERLTRVSEMCDNLNTPKQKLSNCLKSLVYSTDTLKKYKCTNMSDAKPNWYGSHSIEAYMFLTDKECVKTLIKAECEESIMEGIDEHWTEVGRVMAGASTN
ncbi:hypothetical protein L3Y34_006676 [Caenorhabditis briggsae]|uniref:T20D4.11-like domain-containing protein n=1 Tax=Caenorhabditis briggsae TaxID=6238 RepID=A0AAE8ZXE0_CAEBR|nr:hypothetical protein L3Y34_006676 [Caenorhabditis briggsae]